MKRSFVAVLVAGLVTALTVTPGSTATPTNPEVSAAAAAFDAKFPLPEGSEVFADRPITWAHPSVDPVTLKQPNGKTFAARVRPMDIGGGAETWQTGYTVIRRSDGWWVYGVPASGGGVKAGTARVGVDAVPAGLQKHLGVVQQTIWATPADLPEIRAEMFQYMAARNRAETMAAEAAGETRTFKIPVLMLETYAPFQASSTPQHFEDFLMDPAANPTGTFAESYDEMSHGSFQLDVDVYGPFTSVPSQADRCFYGTEGSMFGGQAGLGGGGARGMATEVVPQADPTVDFGQYDNDNDGRVDFLIILHSGPDAAATGDGCQTWSHMFPPVVGEPAQVTSDTNANGDPVTVGIVMTIPEIDLGIGVTAHELMHGIGEPDYYATDYAAAGTGDWDLGAGGSWYGDPPMSNPLHFNPMVKMNQGWITPTLVTGTRLGVTLRPRETNADLLWVPTRLTNDLTLCKLGQFGYRNVTDAFQVGDQCATEGYLLEFASRAAPGALFDRYALSSGLLVWHYDLSLWKQGGNNNPLTAMLDLVEADHRDATQDLQMNLGRGGPGDAFFADPVGMSSATGASLNLTPVGEPQVTTVTGAPAGVPCQVQCVDELAATPTPTFTIDPADEVTAVTATLSWPGGDGNANDWDFYLDRKLADGSWSQVKSGATAANPERITVISPNPGEYRIRAFNFASTESSADVTVEQFAGALPQLGPASTLSNELTRTGWEFTNIRPITGFDGLAGPHELGSGAITLDLVKHDGTTTDVSPDFITTSGPLQAGKANTLSTVVYQHGGKALPAGTKVRFLLGTNPKRSTLIAEQTLPSIPGYGKVTVTQAYTPQAAGPATLRVQVVPPASAGDLVAANNDVATPVVVYPGTASVLVVDDDDSFEADQAYAGALEALKVPYAVATGTASASLMKRFQAVIWHTANQRFEGQLSAAERAAVKEYLAAGGNLWLAGPNGPRAYDASDPRTGGTDPAFLHDYFGVAYVDSLQRGAGTAQGTGDVVGGNAAYEMTTPYARTLMDYFRLGTASDGTASTLGQTNALLTWPSVPGALVGAKLQALDFRTVLTSFDLTQLTQGVDRTKLVGDVLRWFGLPAGTTKYGVSSIHHAPVRTANPGDVVTILASVGGAPTSVTLYYRSHGASTWKSVAMTLDGGLYKGVIPSSGTTLGGVEYYISAKQDRKVVNAPSTAPAGPYYLAIRS